MFSGSGGRIRTSDLRVMSPTSYQTAPPRIKLSFKCEFNSQIAEISQGLSLGRFAGRPICGLSRLPVGHKLAIKAA